MNLKSGSSKKYLRLPDRSSAPMITAGTSPPIHIDLGKDEPGMILQRRYREPLVRNAAARSGE